MGIKVVGIEDGIDWNESRDSEVSQLVKTWDRLAYLLSR